MPRRPLVPRRRALGAAALALGVLLASCAPAPTAGPPLAVRHGGGSPGDDAPADTAGKGPDASATPPAWSDGLSRITDESAFGTCDYLTTPLPEGVHRSCLSFPPAGPLAADAEKLDAVLLSTDTADTSKPPLLLAAGADRSFDAVADAWSRGLADGLAWPVLLVEPRTQFVGDGTCEPPVEQVSDSLVADAADPRDPGVREASAAVARGCQDGVGDHQTEFGVRGQADDLAAVASALGLDEVVVGGSGAGVLSAARFAGDHPDGVRAFVAESPTSLTPTLADDLAARAEGSQMALEAWTAECRRTSCLGAAPVPAAGAALPSGPMTEARAAGLRAGRQALSGVGSADDGVTRRQFRSLADALGDGTVTPAPVTDADTRDAFAQCLARPDRPSADALAGIVPDLASRFPTFGREVGTRASLCTDWPVVSDDPLALPAIPALVLGTTGGDPLGGRDPAGTGSAALTAAGASGAVPLRYGGFGSVAVGTGRCIADGANSFLADPAAAAPTACPA